MADALPNRFDFLEAQPRLYAYWEQLHGFDSDPDSSKTPFCIVIPPPNVTGALHLGHALNNTLQDIVIRCRRMQGFNALWIPGTDHAGIATQAVVERRLREEEGRTRHDLGREQLVERIWKWKAQYETRILAQLKQMGASCDWRRTRFTLDDTCARAVRRTFFDFFRQGLIYRGKRLVNWDTFLQTAVSDDEVFHETVPGNFWHFRYPVVDPRPGEPDHVTIATTRPETMLGDTAVAVHPDPASALATAESDVQAKWKNASEKERPALLEQLADLQRRRSQLLPTLEMLREMARGGRQLRLPLLNRIIPLIADEWARPDMGSGCVKITPAHDPNDYDVGRRHQLPMINILLPDGSLNAEAGPYQGFKIPEARQRVVADMEKLGLLAEVEDREIDLAHSDRSKTPIEPYLADQWFVRMQELAQSAMDAVRSGRVSIIPSRYVRGYLDWLSEKRDWPVSRQLWWGHQIPVWSTVCRDAQDRKVKLANLDALLSQLDASLREKVTHQVEAPEGDSDAAVATIQVCLADGAEEVEPRLEALGFGRDPDVLDTWFSSALWPHSTLGWPDDSPDLKYYYPTSALITSRDIITLWVARMVLTGLNNMGDVPFRQVFIHPKILDGFGETMSKSKGNGVDPLDIIQKFGADALRFGLAHLTGDTQDVRMPIHFECPHCQALMDQTRENRELPRISCSSCRRDFATQWATRPDDVALPRAAVVSERFELARNFTNKLWNAARFVLLGLDGFVPAAVGEADWATEDRWMLSRLASVADQMTEALQSFRFADAARVVYDFAWDDFCSVYVEMMKERLREPAARPAAQRMLAYSLDTLLRLLHPMVPFITEEVWQQLGKAAPVRGLAEPVAARPSVMQAAWPEVQASHRDEVIEARFQRFQTALGAVREIRSRQAIPPKQRVRFAVQCDGEIAELLAPMQPYFLAMAKAESDGFGPSVAAPANAAVVNLPEMKVLVDLTGLIDVSAEISRNQKQRDKLVEMISSKEKRLASSAFVDRAPKDVVARERESLRELQDQLAAVQSALSNLGG